jgi:hypothetical protein
LEAEFFTHYSAPLGARPDTRHFKSAL